jgi:hypothetical protein
VVVLDEGVPDQAGVPAQVVVDFMGEFRRKLRPEHGSVLLLRPDGYVGFHRLGFDPGVFSAVLAEWVRRVEMPPVQERALAPACP